MTTPMTDASYTRSLASLDRGQLADYGAKNATVAEMVRHMNAAGLWAPKGFAVSAKGFDRFVGRGGLRAWIDELLAAARPDRSNVARIADTIRSSILSSEMPADLRREIVARYRGLAEDAGGRPLPVAVLTSPIPGCPLEAAFGGEPPACLFVQEEEAVVAAIRTCYAALYSERAILHRLDRAIANATLRLSVAVQTTIWANTRTRAEGVRADETVFVGQDLVGASAEPPVVGNLQ